MSNEKFAMPRYLKGMNLFVNGKGYAGRVEEIQLPKLTVKTEEFRGGGMDIPVEIDLGMEKLECELTVSDYDATLFSFLGMGSAAGNTGIPVTLRGAMDADGTVVPVTVNLTGFFKEMDMGSWKAGEKSVLKMQAALRHYSLSIGDEKVVEIDMANMKRIIGGADAMADVRSAIGL